MAREGTPGRRVVSVASNKAERQDFLRLPARPVKGKGMDKPKLMIVDDDENILLSMKWAFTQRLRDLRLPTDRRPQTYFCASAHLS